MDHKRIKCSRRRRWIVLAFIGIAVRFTIFVVHLDDLRFFLLEGVESILSDCNLGFLVRVLPLIALRLGVISSKVDAGLGGAAFAVMIGIVTANLASIAAFDNFELMVLFGIGSS